MSFGTLIGVYTGKGTEYAPVLGFSWSETGSRTQDSPYPVRQKRVELCLEEKNPQKIKASLVSREPYQLPEYLHLQELDKGGSDLDELDQCSQAKAQNHLQPGERA